MGGLGPSWSRLGAVLGRRGPSWKHRFKQINVFSMIFEKIENLTQDGPEDGPYMAQDAPRRPETTPRGLQDGPRTAPRRPKTAP